MKVTLGKSWGKRLQGKIESYNFEVGVLEDKPHYDPVDPGFGKPPELRNYAGKPVRKQSRTKGEMTTGEIFVSNMKRLNINFLLRPFQEEGSEILKFTESFLKLVSGRNGTSLKRLENLLQAIVRNPILREEYGKNRASTADDKGFDRHLFDTGQMFKAIKARVTRV